MKLSTVFLVSAVAADKKVKNHVIWTTNQIAVQLLYFKGQIVQAYFDENLAV